MTPLAEIARLLAKYGQTAKALEVRSLDAREEMRVELERFWADLSGPGVFGAADSVASVVLGFGSAPPTPELERDRERFGHALWLVADDLSLRGVASPESEAFRIRYRAAQRAESA